MKNRLRAALGAIVFAGHLGLGAQAQTTPPAGRLLASNCFQCHGTNGYSSAGFDKLVGMTADELLHKMQEMQSSGERGIMNVHALGYSDAQIRSLAAFFASQPKP
jgi:cytochrome subunit of sulfide dehydrogenase